MESHSLKQWFWVTCTRLDWLSNLRKEKNFPLGSTGNYFSVVFALPWSMKPISFLGSGEFTQHDQFPVIVCRCHCGEGKAALLDHFDTKSCHLEIDQDIKLWASNDNHKEIQRLMKSWRESGLYKVSYYWLMLPLFPLMACTSELAAPKMLLEQALWVGGTKSIRLVQPVIVPLLRTSVLFQEAEDDIYTWPARGAARLCFSKWGPWIRTITCLGAC